MLGAVEVGLAHLVEARGIAERLRAEPLLEHIEAAMAHAGARSDKGSIPAGDALTATGGMG